VNNLPPLRDRGRSDFVQISAGANHTCALHDSGKLQCWGTGEWNGEVTGPNGSTDTDFVQVMADAYQTCALHADHRIRCWGNDISGVNSLGDQDFVQVSGSIEVDGYFFCGLHTDGTVSCFGSNESGRLTRPAVRQP
jgi:alpha-tubulin suppressor-like RCC1 family protein